MKIIDKFFTDKKGSAVIYILLTVGILLLTAGSGMFSPKKTEKPVAAESKAESSTEEKLEKILSQINGRRARQCVIVTKNSGEKKFGCDTDGKQKKTVILSRGGGEEALVSEEIMPEISGVIIVAEGGGKSSVKAELTHAAQTALAIAPHKIEVFERKDSQ